MKVDVDAVSATQKKIRIELPGDAVAKEFLRAYESLNRRARIKGFRPGKAPLSVLQGIYGEEIKGQVLSRLVENSLSEVFKERGLKVVSDPEIEAESLEEGKALAFSALVEVRPEIEVKDYSGLELERVKLSVDEAQVERALGRLQDIHAQLVPVEEREVVERGDFVSLDFSGTVEGKSFPGGKAENYQLEVGSGNALPEFEAALPGLKKNLEHTISVRYPEDHFNRELAGKQVVFAVTVREIKKKVLPSLDDDFAKDHGDSASLDELKQKIRARLESELAEIQTRELKEQLARRLVEAHPFEVPPSMIERQTRYLLERQQSRPEAQASPTAAEKESMERRRLEVEPHAVRQVKAMLLIDKIAEKEKIDVSAEEVERRIDQMARSAGEKAAALRKFYAQEHARESLRSQMISDRALDFLLGRANVKDVEPPVDAGEKKG